MAKSGGMEIKITVDLSKIKGLKLLTSSQLDSVLRQLGSKYQKIVRDRVKAGESVEGGAFVGYDPEYQDRKRRAGRLNKDFWLRMSGGMFNSMKPRLFREAKKRGVSVGFDGEHMVYRFKKEAKRKTKKKAKSSSMAPNPPKAKTAARAPKPTTPTKPKQSGGGRLVYVETSGEATPNALIAAANDAKRPFIGLNAKEVQNFYKFAERLVYSKVKK